VISSDDLDLLRENLGRFGDHVTATLFPPGHDATPDGDLGAVAGLLGESAGMELTASPSPGCTRHDYGVWGRHVLTDGCRLSLEILAGLAEACAGIGACVHAQGIGCLALDGWKPPGPGSADAEPVGSHDTVAAVFVPPYGVALDNRTSGDGVHIDTATRRLVGASPFVWSASAPERLVVFARSDTAGGRDADHRGWVVAAVPTEAPGVRIVDVGARVGLRALSQFQVEFDGAVVDEASVVASGPAAESVVTRVVACDWLGNAALALGTSRRARREAGDYAQGRYQGGHVIARHAAVRLLLAEADHDVATMEALVGRLADEPLESMDAPDLLRWAIDCRLAVGEHAHRAVTNSVQALGGYGYLDDYGLSKRLRDVSALRVRHGGREQVLLLRQGLAQETTA